eukprot:5542521-Amphidinium_carterae.1
MWRACPSPTVGVRSLAGRCCGDVTVGRSGGTSGPDTLPKRASYERLALARARALRSPPRLLG